MNKRAWIIMLFMGVLFFDQAFSQGNSDIRNVALFLHDGVEILDFAGPMEVFLQAGFNVYTIGESKEPLIAMGALKIIPDYGVEDFPTPDVISFYGGGIAHLKSQDPQFKKWVADLTKDADILFSVCTGAYFLAENGFLEDKKATTFHSSIGDFQERFPAVNVLSDVRFVDNGNVITTAGISAGIDGALHLVAKVLGDVVAENVARNMEYDKWVPGEGLVLENEFLKLAKEKGFSAALNKVEQGELKMTAFKGELIRLGTTQLQGGAKDEALEIFEYIVNTHQASMYDYRNLGEALKANGKEAPPSEEEFLELIRKGEIKQARNLFLNTQKTYPGWIIFREFSLNDEGYRFLGKNEAETALEIFKLNVEAYPAAFNTYDSLAETYMILGKNKEAIANYQKSLELNPENHNARRMIEKITAAN